MGTSKDAGRACGLEGRRLEEVTPASWRGFTAFDPATRRANVSFQVEGGGVLRLSLSASCLVHIAECLDDFLPQIGLSRETYWATMIAEAEACAGRGCEACADLMTKWAQQ